MTDRAAQFRKRLSALCLDIRRLRTARVYDQKVTPDVVTIVADTVSRVAPSDEPFSVKSVWDSPEFEDAVTVIFGKPSAADPLADGEYDKLVGQPILALRHAGVLSGEKKRGVWEYRIASAPVLREIAASEMAALDFLAEYAAKILKDSGLGKKAARFFEKQDKRSLGELESAFSALIFTHTGINNKAEIGRIFPKLLNVAAFKRKSRGRIAGRLSRGRITLYDIRYNRVNWRDAGKPKDITRREADMSRTERPMATARDARMADEIKAFHNRSPEIADSHSGGGVVEAHHIFPRSDYPELARVSENIILLTPTQHRAFAHSGQTGNVSGGYQLLCLLKKLDAVEKCESDPDCNFYSISDFIGMLVFCDVLDDSPAKKLRHKSEEPAASGDERKKIIRQVADDLRRHLTARYAAH